MIGFPTCCQGLGPVVPVPYNPIQPNSPDNPYRHEETPPSKSDGDPKLMGIA